MNPKLKEFTGSYVRYDNTNQQIYGGKDDQLLIDVRGWGAIQQMFIKPGGELDFEAAEAFQNELGQFFADAINEKLNEKLDAQKIAFIGAGAGIELAQMLQEHYNIKELLDLKKDWHSVPVIPKPMITIDIDDPPPNRNQRRKLSRKQRKRHRKR